MHRIVTPEGGFVQSKWMKAVAMGAYACFTMAGAAMLLSPRLPHLVAQPDGTIAVVFLLVGGLCCLLGILSDRWVGEYVGLPLLGVSFPVLGLLILRGGHAQFPFASVAILLVFLGTGFMFSARWRMIVAIKDMAHHVASQRAERDGQRVH